MQNELHTPAGDVLVRREPGAALARQEQSGIELEPGLTLLPRRSADGDRIVIEVIAAALAR